MDSKNRFSVSVATLALVAFNVAVVLYTLIPAFGDGWWIHAAVAAEGESGEKAGGHGKGGEKEGASGGTEEKGHGTKYKHQGHAGGQHSAGSSHQAGGDNFGGGNSGHGNSQVPEGVGRYGAGFSNLSTSDQGHFRYWGGWRLPVDPTTPTDTTFTTATEVITGSGGGASVNVRNTLDTASRCEGVSPRMQATQQFSGGNLLRLNAARGLVDPALAASGEIASPYVMGNLQIELVKASPNTELVGTYIGLVAKAPVSADTVKKIAFQMCSKVSDTQAQEIAQIAEQQRAMIVAGNAR